MRQLSCLNWKFALDEHNVVVVVSTDMSKAFDSLYHPLTLAKLKAYGVEERSLRLMGSYFTDRYNRVKLGSVVSEWQRVTRRCPQGSAFGPLIWNIFQNDLTYTVNANMNMYADDHQFYVVRSTLSDVHDDLAVCAESASSFNHCMHATCLITTREIIASCSPVFNLLSPYMAFLPW